MSREFESFGHRLFDSQQVFQLLKLHYLLKLTFRFRKKMDAYIPIVDMSQSGNKNL